MEVVNNTMYNLKAIIIGAGMAGLTAGIAMRQAGYEVEIYEKTKCTINVMSRICIYESSPYSRYCHRVS